ncbi:imm11 family protein [Nocardia sp. NPDC049149]|uniref:imm11 family protein n=1 Tax=Nocardia sp. NPDC049149 TaxID=3364315 RepID=UPI0037230BD0
MRIYVGAPRAGFEWAMPVDSDDTFEHLTFAGVPKADSWRTVQMESIREDGNEKPSDFPWFLSATLVLKDRAIDVLGPVLAEFGELLPAQFPDARLAVFNVLNVVDALDESAAKIARFSSGEIMMIESHAFHPDRIPPRAVFKIPQQLYNGEIFYTDEIVREIEASGFTGLWFKAVWDTENGSYGNRFDAEVFEADRVV